MYEKLLAFDCDAPPCVQSIICQSRDKGYGLLISNCLFEIWLLMHFEQVENKLSKREIFQRLSHHLGCQYRKGSHGLMRKIIHVGDVEKAIANARSLAEKYKGEQKSVFHNIKDMDPFTGV